MKRSILSVALFLMIAGSSSLYAQNNDQSPIKIDTTRIKLQLALAPSFHNFTNKNLQLRVNNLYNYQRNRLRRYLDIFNSIMAQLLLVKVSEEIDMHDYLNMEFNLGRTHNVFQYNLMRRRTEFYKVSDLHKKYWW